MTSSLLSSSLSHVWIFWDRCRLVGHLNFICGHPGTHSRGTVRKSGELCEKISLLGFPPTLPLGLQTTVAAAASPCCSAPGRCRSPFGPLARRPGPADMLSARPDLMQGPGGSAPPPGCPPLQNVPGSGDLRLGFRASRASVGRGGSPADALCGKRLRLPALRSWSWTAPSGGGPDDVSGGFSVSGVCNSSGCNFYC